MGVRELVGHVRNHNAEGPEVPNYGRRGAERNLLMGWF